MSQQPEQQRQGQITLKTMCPGCRQPMKLVGRENEAGCRADLLTFQCDCGQIYTMMTS